MRNAESPDTGRSEPRRRRAVRTVVLSLLPSPGSSRRDGCGRGRALRAGWVSGCRASALAAASGFPGAGGGAPAALRPAGGAVRPAPGSLEALGSQEAFPPGKEQNCPRDRDAHAMDGECSLPPTPARAGRGAGFPARLWPRESHAALGLCWVGLSPPLPPSQGVLGVCPEP